MFFKCGLIKYLFLLEKNGSKNPYNKRIPRIRKIKEELPPCILTHNSWRNKIKKKYFLLPLLWYFSSNIKKIENKFMKNKKKPF